MSGWTWMWLAWIAGFAAIEGAALWRNNRDNLTEGKARRTLSAHLWAWFGFRRGQKPNGWAWARRGLAVAALVWLGGHIFGGGTWWWWEA